MSRHIDIAIKLYAQEIPGINVYIYSALAILGNDSQFRAQNSYLKLVGHNM